MAKRSISWLVALFFSFVLSCSSDPEGPVSRVFVEDGTYGVQAGKVSRDSIPENPVGVSVPLGVGTSKLLALGRLVGIEYQAILLKFDFTLSNEDAAKTVAWARFRFPVKFATEHFAMPVTVNELLADFTEEDTITAVPPFAPQSIPDSLGRTIDTLSIKNVEFTIDTSAVNGWLKGTRGQHGLAIVRAAPPDADGSIEMNAHELGTDPASVRVHFTDGDSASFGAVEDYAVAIFKGTGLNCLGGIAKRIYFGFNLHGINERAMIQASFLVLKVKGGEGFDATSGELAMGLSPDFLYYLYAPPNAHDTLAAYSSGVGVDLGTFDPTESKTIRMPLRGYISDILRDKRQNYGLVLQSNQEMSRIQRASFGASGAEAPYIEVIYSLPADFKGTK